MEIYGILAQDFWPLIQSNSELYEEFIDQTVNEDEPDTAVVLYEHSDAFKFVDGLLNDGERRIQSLADKEDFNRSQQYISDVCNAMISFAKARVEHRTDSKIKKRSVGRPKKTEFKNGNILAAGATVKIRGNAPMTRLCEKMFSLPVGESIHWTDLFQHIYETHDDAPRDGWRRIVAIVKRTNDKVMRNGIELIFKFEGVESGLVRRLS